MDDANKKTFEHWTPLGQSKKGSVRPLRPCCDMSQNDTIGKIELNPSFVLSSDNTNCKNDIQ